MYRFALFFVACLSVCGIAGAQEGQVPRGADFQVTSEVTKVDGGFQFLEGPTATSEGMVLFTDIPAKQIWSWVRGERPKLWLEESRRANGLMYESGGQIVACQMEGSVVAIDAKSKQVTVLAESFAGTRLNAPNDLVIDETGGLYFTDPRYGAPEPLPQGIESFYYIDLQGRLTRMSGNLPAPNGIGLSPDGKALYVVPSMSAEMLVYDVLSPGKLSEARVFCKLKQPTGFENTGGDGMAVDTLGNVLITTKLGVQVFSPAGEWLTTISIPEEPANVAFAGQDSNMLVVTARSGLYTVEVSTSGLGPRQLQIKK